MSWFARTLATVVFGIGLLCLGPLAELSAQGKRLPVPEAKALARSEALIKDVFGEEIARAKAPESLVKLANEMIQQGDDPKAEAADRYVLYRASRDLAARAGDATLALGAAEKLIERFDISALDTRAATLTLVAENTTSKEANRGLVDLVLPLIADAVDADNYEVALQLGDLAEKAAKKAQNIPLIRAVSEKKQEVLAVQKGFARLQPFVDRLKKDPKDAEANLELGKYFGLLKGKWERALPLLAMGGDEGLRKQARADIAHPKKAPEQMAVADGWWELADNEKDPAKLNLQRRAMHWYDQALPDLRGLSRLKASKRLEVITARLAGGAIEGPVGKVGELRKFEGHTDEVRSVAFSLDGRHAVSGGVDHTVRVWSLQGKEEFILRGHSAQVYTVAFHPNNTQVFSASWDATVRGWDFKSGNEVKRFTHPKDVNGLALSRDGAQLLTGCDNQFAYLWKVGSGEEVKRFGEFGAYVYGVAFAPNGVHVAAGSKDRSLRVFDITTGNPVRVIENLPDPVTGVAFTSDSRFVLGCGDNAVHQYEIATGKEHRRFEVKSGRVLALAVSSDGRRLLTGGEDKTLRLWDLNTGKELHKFEGHTDTINSVAFSHDGRFALSGGLDRTVRLWGLPR